MLFGYWYRKGTYVIIRHALNSSINSVSTTNGYTIIMFKFLLLHMILEIL